MDILVSSNFERYLFDLFDRSGPELRDFMAKFTKESLSVSDQQWARVTEEFDSATVNDEGTCEIIAEVHASHGVLLDPHTAVGLRCARECWQDRDVPMVTLSTAHPAKFAEAINKAGLDSPELPPHLADLFEREERYSVVANDLTAVTDYIKSNI